jgi:hypothetical protein
MIGYFISNTHIYFICVSFEILIFRGDLTRERKNRIKVLKDANLTITGLAIRATGKQTHLFVAMQNSVFLYNISVKDKEFKSTLDTMGCAQQCSVLADTMQDGHFMIGRNDVNSMHISCSFVFFI